MGNSNANSKEEEEPAQFFICKNKPIANRFDKENKKIINGLVKNILSSYDDPSLTVKNYLNKIHLKNQELFQKSAMNKKINSEYILEFSNEITNYVANKITLKDTNSNLYDSQNVYPDLYNYFYKDLMSWSEKINLVRGEEHIIDIIDNEASNIIDSSMSYKSSDFFNSSVNSGTSDNLAKKSILNNSKSIYKSPTGKRLKGEKRFSKGNFWQRNSIDKSGIFGNRRNSDNKYYKANMSKVKANKLNNSNMFNPPYKKKSSMIKNFNTNKYALRFSKDLQNNKFIRKKSQIIDDSKANYKNKGASITIDLRKLNNGDSIEKEEEDPMFNELNPIYEKTNKLSSRKSNKTDNKANSSRNLLKKR